MGQGGGYIWGPVISAPFGLPIDPDVKVVYMGLISRETAIVRYVHLQGVADPLACLPGRQ